MVPVDNQMDTAVQRPESSWASGPSCLGGSQKAVVVLLVVPLGVLALLLVMLLGALAWVLVVPGRMVPRVLAGLVA